MRLTIYLPLSLAAVLALSACGDDDDTRESSTSNGTTSTSTSNGTTSTSNGSSSTYEPGPGEPWALCELDPLKPEVNPCLPPEGFPDDRVSCDSPGFGLPDRCLFDCEDDAQCDGIAPGGECNQGFYCFWPGEPVFGYRRVCSADVDCESYHTCVTITDSLGEQESSCRPTCSSDADCGEGGRCNRDSAFSHPICTG